MATHEKTNLGIWISGLILLSGCASLNDFCYEQTQQARARSEYRGCASAECSKYPRDYKKGWMDGFYEVATGGCLTPPAIAPQCYWNPSQLLDDCDNRRHQYYSGWQDGAARASEFPDTHYLKIYETCECPFPRCDCPQDRCCPQNGCGCGNGDCNGGCTDALGMPYHEGTIESDREIMMMPIPETTPPVAPAMPTESSGSAEPLGPTATPAAPEAVREEELPPGKPNDMEGDTGDLPPLPPEPLDEDMPPPPGNLPEALPEPVKPEPIGSASDRDVSYDFGDDNSMTIEFAPANEPINVPGLSVDQSKPRSQDASNVQGTVQAQFGKLSDFDVRAENGLIE